MRQRHDLQEQFRRGNAIRRAHRRESDPAWAKAKFAEGGILHRFAERKRDHLAWDIQSLLEELDEVAGIAANRADPVSGKAAALFRGLFHRRANMDSLQQEARTLIRQAARAALRARRHDVLRPAAALETDGLTGALCVSLDQITQLGRESGNCLAEDQGYWERFMSGKLDVWALREAGRLVAVLAVERNKARVSTALGPRNAAVSLQDAQKIARFCARAGWAIGEGCKGLLPEFAEPIRVGPHWMMIGKQVAIYAEWRHAVRIDMSGETEVADLFPFVCHAKMPTLAFDPAKSCADEILDDREPREAVERFGAKRLRKVMRNVALGHAAPTLVQHRLLALAA